MSVAGGRCARIAAILSGKFLKRLQGRLVLTIVLRPRGDLAEVQSIQQLADGPLMVADAPALLDQRLQVGAAPPGQVAEATQIRGLTAAN